MILSLDLIRTDGDTQQRELEQNVVDEYAELMEQGVVFPEIRVIYDKDNNSYWLWDGFHRLEAMKKIGITETLVDINDGDYAYAISCSYSANKDHGLRRQPGVVKKIIIKMLNDPTWFNQLDADIALHVGCNRSYVSKVRAAELDKAHKEDVQAGQVTLNDKNCPVLEADENDEQDQSHLNETDEVQQPKEKIFSDETGRQIPKNLVSYYLSKRKVENLINKVTGIKRELNAAVKDKEVVFHDIDLKRFDVDCKNLRNTLKATLPFAVCPYCGGDANDCKACKGYGFVNELVWNAAPEELKET